MSNTFAKILSILLAVLFAIAAILGLLFYMKVVPVDAAGEVITEDLMKYVNWILMYAAILLVLVVFVAFIVNPLLKIVSNPKGVIRSVISIAVLAAIVGISYSMGTVEEIKLVEPVENLDGKQILADTTLYAAYILSALVVLAIVVGEGKKLLKL